MRRGRLAAALACCAALARCGCDAVPPDAVTSCEAEVRIGAARTDVLFVVDESNSMTEEQANLRQNLGAFVDGLANAPVRNDFQIAVTTTSVENFDGGTVYTNAASPNACDPAASPGCVAVPFPDGTVLAVARDAGGAAVPGRLDWTAAGGFGGARLVSAGSPTLAGDFRANVSVGTFGTGKEQPFRAARHALEKAAPGGPNAGFLRSGARLAVVFLSDEDDCSDTAGLVPTASGTGNTFCHENKDQLDPVADFADFLNAPIGGEDRQALVAVIAGYRVADLAPLGCATSFDTPDRYHDLASRLGPGRSLEASICDPSFGPALGQIAALLVPQVVPLEGAPPDPRMLVVKVLKADGRSVACPVAEAGSAGAAAAGAVFHPPREGIPASLAFQGDCALHQQDRVDVKIVCAG